ncbi:MAG: hypothetical protein U9N44_01245 [Chloroflexota bacterium]|nr:hypothetical protein [Chloroflexota bacterium]
MKRLIAFSILLAICLVTAMVSPVAAQGEIQEYVQLSKPLSVDRASNDGYSIPVNSTIYHRDNRVTEIYGPDKKHILSAKDSEAGLVTTPSGYAPATRVHQVPSGTCIVHDDNVTNVYDNNSRNNCLLTIVDQNSKVRQDFPATLDWIEDSHSKNQFSYLTTFVAKWTVPSSPPDAGGDATCFLFNGIQPTLRTFLLQPVLEWNQKGSHRWTGAAWYYQDDDNWFRATSVNANTGNTIHGNMWYVDDPWIPDEGWIVQLFNTTTGQGSTLQTYGYCSTFRNLRTVCALEGKRITDNNDVPGDTTFCDMYCRAFGQNLNIDWGAHVSTSFPLTDLGVDIYSSSKVRLRTAN